MNKKIKVFLIVLFGFVSVGFSFMHAISNVAASSLTDGLIYKATYQGVYRCYKNGYVKSSFPVSDYSSIGSLIKKDSGSGYVALVTGAKTSSYNIGDSNLTCKELFKGGMYGAGISGSNDDLLTANGKKAPSVSNTEKVNELLKNMGYTIKEASGDGASCFYLPYTAKMKNGSTNKGNTNKLCKKNGTFYTEGRKLASAKAERKPTFVVKSGQVCLYLPSTSNAHGGANAGELCRSSSEVKMTKNGVRDFVVGICKNGGRCITSVGDFIFDAGAPAKKTTSGSAFNAKFKTDGKTAGKTAVKYLSDGMYNNAGVDKKGISLSKSFAVSRLEKRMLYQWYLKNYYNMDVVCDKKQSAAAYDAEVYWLKSGKSKPEKCHVDKGKIKHKEQPVNGVDGSGFFRNHYISGPDALISELNKMKDDEYSDEELKSLKDLKEKAEEKEGTETTSADGDVCYEGSGALGWILCPVIKGLSAAGEFMWKAVSEMLNIPAREMFADSKGVFQAWDIVKNIANVMFIILFLIVIFSQLTGVGIDNYGIKRVLPKIIIAAILINLSYVICELAVDISNILGSGLQNMFASQAGTIDLGKEAPAGSAVAGGIVDLALVGSGAYLYTLFNPLGTIAIGIAVVSVIISIVVAVAFLFLILVIRQAGVIIMVVLAPAAIACYMLPNTEKLFKKWFDLFKALLVVFPICGAIVGAGVLASAVLGSIDNTAMKVAAMIVQVVPFFLIPTLLKQSLSLMGNIGAGLQGVAGRMRRGASGAAGNAMKNSEMLQSLDNKLGMHSLSSRRRQRAFNSEKELMEARFRRQQDSTDIGSRLAAARAEIEERAVGEDVGRRVAAMKRDGITLDNGKKTTFGLDGITTRLGELRTKKTLTDGEQSEVAALMHAAAGISGGGGKMAAAIRGGERDKSGRRVNNTSAAFMKAVASSYSRDGDVKSKLSEKDGGASMYVEQFMSGGSLENSENFKTFDDYKSDLGDGYQKELSNRVRFYETGIGQSGEAQQEYLSTLQEDDCKRIMADEKLMNGLAQPDRKAFLDYAKDRYGIEDTYSGTSAGVSSSDGGATGGGEGELIIDPHAADEAFRRGRESGEFKLPK